MVGVQILGKEQEMDIFWDILLQTDKILAPVFGALGLGFSILLLSSPKRVQSLSNAFNRKIDVDSRIAYIDRSFKMRGSDNAYSLWIGICLLVGSFVSVFFLFYRFDPSGYVVVFAALAQYTYVTQLVLPAVVWCLRAASLIGIVIGLYLVLSPRVLEEFEDRMNGWFETQSAVKRIEQPSIDVDAFLLRHRIAFGIVGLSLSALIILLSILSFAG